MSQTIKCGHCEKIFNVKVRYCPHCGAENKKEATIQTPLCPRCKCPLGIHGYRDTELDICPECSGLWLDAHEFKRLSLKRDVYSDDSIPYEYQRKPLPEDKGYLPCVRCGTLMTRNNFRKISGVLIDKCSDHGVWLDAGELEQIRSFIANGGLEESHDKRIMRNSEEIQAFASRLKGVEFTQKVLHFWNFKYWLFKSL